MKPVIVVLATGGTIAGTAASAEDHTGYVAAQVGVEALLLSIPNLQATMGSACLKSEQIAQIDSKDMDFDTMLALAHRCAYYLTQPDVKAVIVTHGTDTIEETAYFLHCLLPGPLQRKPVVMTCAMRPATSSQADGPRNLLDAMIVAQDERSHGVLVVCAGDVHHALDVQKIHSFALNAFASGDEACGLMRALGRVEAGQLMWRDGTPPMTNTAPNIASCARSLKLESIANEVKTAGGWPRVEVVMNHAHASGCVVDALLGCPSSTQPLRGIVVAATGNGTLSVQLEAAVDRARCQGVDVVIASRCAWGGIHAGSPLSAVKARIDMVLKLLTQSR